MTQTQANQQLRFTPTKNQNQQAIQEIDEKQSLSGQKNNQVKNHPQITGQDLTAKNSQEAKVESLKQRQKYLSKMARNVLVSTVSSLIILIIIVGSYYIYTVNQGPQFHNAPIQIEALYEANQEKIVYYYFKMNEPYFIKVGKLVEGYVEAVYYLYTGSAYQAKTVGRITLMHKQSGIFLKAFNPKNIEMQYDLESILQSYATAMALENKRLLQNSEAPKTDIKQNQKGPSFVQILHQSITTLFASMTNVDPSTLLNLEETTFVGTKKTDSKQQIFQIKNKSPKTDNNQSSQLELINSKQMNQAEKIRLVNDIIQKVIQPVLKDLIRQVIEYGPNIAEKVGVIFDDSVDLRVTYEKVIILDGNNQDAEPRLTSYRNQPIKLVTRQNEQVYANKPSNPTDTKTMTQRCFNAINSCTNLDENTKVCTKEQWMSDDTPFPRNKQSKENEKNYQEYNRNRVTTKNSLSVQRKLVGTDTVTSNQVNSGTCGSKSGNSNTLSSNQS